MTYHGSFLALCDGCKFFVPRCLRVHPRAAGRQDKGRRYGKFSEATIVLCDHCRSQPAWRDKFKVAAEHR